MFNVCPSCGIYSVEKEVRPGLGWQALAVCKHCGHARPFLRLPLFNVSGASGSGKTAMALFLSGRDVDFIHLESDILWRSEYDSPETDYREYRETWLRVAKNINQAGRPVLLYGSAVSSQFEQCSERRFFARIHTLALVCEPDILAGRLRARPSWRSADGDEFIQNMLNFNRWLIDHSSSELSILDTSNASLEDTASAILRWAAGYWHAPFQERMEI